MPLEREQDDDLTSVDDGHPFLIQTWRAHRPQLDLEGAKANPKEHERKRLPRSDTGFFLLVEGLDEVLHAQRSNNV